MRKFRVYYCSGSDSRFWSRDIEVEDDESWDFARSQVIALPDSELFPPGVDITKSECEFTGALEMGDSGYKDDAFSTVAREVTSLTHPDPVDFPQTTVLDETTFGKPMRRVAVGQSSDFKKHRNSAERAKVGLDAGKSSGVGNS